MSSGWLNSKFKSVVVSPNKDRCWQSSNSHHQTIMAPLPHFRRISNNHWLISSRTRLANRNWMMMIIVMIWSSKILISKSTQRSKKLRVMNSHPSRRNNTLPGRQLILQSHPNRPHLAQYLIKLTDLSPQMSCSQTSCRVKKWYGLNKLKRLHNLLHKTTIMMLKMLLRKCCDSVIVKSPAVFTNRTQTP